MLLGVKFFNTTLTQKIVQTVVSIADKCHAKNENFFIISTKQEDLLSEIDKTIWTFSSSKFIPHSIINEQDYLLYGKNVKNLLSNKISDFFETTKDSKINLVLVTTKDSDPDIFYNNLALELKLSNNQIVLAVVTQCSDNFAMPYHIENFIKNLQEQSINYEIWQNYDLGWEKVF
jgi:hypothetical protein